MEFTQKPRSKCSGVLLFENELLQSSLSSLGHVVDELLAVLTLGGVIAPVRGRRAVAVGRGQVDMLGLDFRDLLDDLGTEFSTAFSSAVLVDFFAAGSFASIESIISQVLGPLFELGALILLIASAVVLLLTILMLIAATRFIKYSRADADIFARKKGLLVFYFILDYFEKNQIFVYFNCKHNSSSSLFNAYLVCLFL